MSQNNGNYGNQPFMFGGYNAGQSQSAMTFSQSRPTGRGESVRDCMYWPMTSSNEQQNNSSWGASNFGQMGGSGAAPVWYYNQAPQETNKTKEAPAPVPVAYMTVPGKGGKGERPFQIPVKIGPAGATIDSFGTFPKMEPLVINTSLPSSGNGMNEPFFYPITAEQYSAYGKQS